MLSTSIAVPHGQNVEDIATARLLHLAHLKQVHLARPLSPTITPVPHAFREVANLLNLDPDEDHDFYKVECETKPCPPT